MATFDAKGLKESLAYNIGLMAKGLKADGVDTAKVDRLAHDAMEMIELRALEINEKEDERYARNITQTVVMVLMHAVLSEQDEFIAKTAGGIGVSPEKVVELMMKDTLEK